MLLALLLRLEISSMKCAEPSCSYHPSWTNQPMDHEKWNDFSNDLDCDMLRLWGDETHLLDSRVFHQCIPTVKKVEESRLVAITMPLASSTYGRPAAEAEERICSHRDLSIPWVAATQMQDSRDRMWDICWTFIVFFSQGVGTKKNRSMLHALVHIWSPNPLSFQISHLCNEGYCDPFLCDP